MKPAVLILACVFYFLSLFSKSEQGCSILVHKDIKDFNLVGKTAGKCLGKTLNITILNEYRAYCYGSCNNIHYAYTPTKSRITLRPCTPVPLNGNYNVVRHENFNATCESGTKWELVDFEYVNATKCQCQKLMEKYIDTVPT